MHCEDLVEDHAEVEFSVSYWDQALSSGMRTGLVLEDQAEDNAVDHAEDQDEDHQEDHGEDHA